jgi:hypothetical protein
LTAGQRAFLELFNAKRYRNCTQRDAVLALEREHGTERLLKAGRWAAKKGLGLGQAVVSVETALKNERSGNGKRRRHHPAARGVAGAGDGRPPTLEGKHVLPGVTEEQMQAKLSSLERSGGHGGAATAEEV